ncbi:uncharacterized protein MEPE_06775 [Melanopsichium pennsylvanicum]|uniref:Uncharacterized protein n=2 Tax=Melanopsichium pennsylvanicum TaxID=63383 RepID=A0AAJ5C8W3_9BASI|nr:conserved hypothetical protein [Melanopsichium pennsylvanicum 4]SNX88064.1 uncharacterized protein MEPE_06775 [Melanopsichium pennsylvanicum]
MVEGRIASTLTLQNVRLLPEAYSALNNITVPQDQKSELPLVDLQYIHYEPSSNSSEISFVEVHVAPSTSSSDKVQLAFDPSQPFQSTCVDSTRREPGDALSTWSQKSLLVSRITIPSCIASGISNMPHKCIDTHGSLAIPGGLCHPHIHLDKPYLLSRTLLETGTFSEALSSTAKAKALFTPLDLRKRMRRLVATSISHGVTSMRAFVEVDPAVGLMCLESGIEVKKEFEHKCFVQLVAFAQDPIFYPEDLIKQQEMQELLREAASRVEVDVVGSAPYVETLSKQDQRNLQERQKKKLQKQQQRKNVDFIFDLAQEYDKHVDFHLDYDLSPPGPSEDGEESMIPYVVRISNQQRWQYGTSGKQRRVTMGHCTKLSTFSDSDLDQLAEVLPQNCSSKAVPPVSFVALPSSDLYMQARDETYMNRSRATLPLLGLKSHPKFKGKHVNWAIGVNNVANLFTPQGDADPLTMLPGLVGIWQSAKPQDCETLLSGISTSARIAAGLQSDFVKCKAVPDVDDDTSSAQEGGKDSFESDQSNIWADLVVIDGTHSIQEACCAPSYSRITIKDAIIVSRRRVESQVYP